MKAVMLSIRPEWCDKIVNGFKTIEIRKTKPKLETPFKCYIYCTKPKFPHEDHIVFFDKCRCFYGGGKVIGEFVCDDVFQIKVFDNASIRNWNFYNLADACVPYDELAAYIGPNKTGYGWHISQLQIYDTPKELREFRKLCIHGDKDVGCFQCEKSGYNADVHIDCFNYCDKPPQSWYYMEELE